MFIRILIIAGMLIILFSLFRSLYFLATEKNSKKTVNNLTWRVGLATLFFILIIIGFYTGVIEPQGSSAVIKNQ